MSYQQNGYGYAQPQANTVAYGQPQQISYAQPGYVQPTNAYHPQQGYPQQQAVHGYPALPENPDQHTIAYVSGKVMVAPNTNVIPGGHTLATTSDFILAKRVRLGPACVPVAKFDIYDAATSSDSSKFLMKDWHGHGAFMFMKDETECPSVCCGNGFRAYRYNTYDRNSNQVLSRVEKECQFPSCFCACRPEFDIKDGQGREVAHVIDQFRCCSYRMEMTNAAQGPFRIEGADNKMVLEMPACQWGVMCPCCFGPCREARFSVKDGNDQLYAEGTKVNNCLSQMCDEMGTLKVKFSSAHNNSGEKEKRLAIINMIAMMEKLHFSESNSESNNRHNTSN